MSVNFKLTGPRVEEQDYARIGKEIGVGPAEVRAVVEVEAAGSGTDSQGRLKMLFEPHIFYRLLSGVERMQAEKEGLAYPKWRNGYPKDSYPRLLEAMKINEEAALCAASWGLPQIMGFNFKLAGYESVYEMLEDFCRDEDNHIEAMIRFIKNSKLDDEIRAHNWAGFAKGYNGTAYKKNKYDTKLATAFAKWKKYKFEGYDVKDETKNSLKESEIKALQEKLNGLNYFVGRVDGVYGARTRSAIRDFQDDHNLKVDGVAGPATLAALAVAGKREDRDVTVADLKEAGSKTVQAVSVNNIAAAVVAAGGVAKGAQEVGLLETIQSTVDQINQMKGVLEQVTQLVEFASQNWWVAAIGGAGVVWYYGKKMIENRVAEARSGANLSK